jgi:hypothetical protein
VQSRFNPDRHSSAERTDDPTDVAFALKESAFTDFLYSHSGVEHKVEQLFGDSKTLELHDVRTNVPIDEGVFAILAAKR